MKRFLTHLLVPHAENGYAPHLLREPAIIAIMVAVVLLFGAEFFYTGALLNSNFFAEILPGVVVDLTNRDRISRDALPLAESPLLTAAAQKKADDMADKGYFAHVSPDGRTPWDWLGEAGYRFSYAGENLAVHFTDSGDVEAAWLNSPGHRANIFNKNFTEMGVAISHGTYQGVLTTFVVEMFGRPAIILAAPAPAALPSSVRGHSTLGAPASKKSEPRRKSSAFAPAPTSLALGAPTTPARLETVAENGMSVIVRDTGAVAAEIVQVPGPGPSRILSWLRKVLTSPNFMFELAYGLALLLVGIAFLLAIVIEVHRQHPKHVAYGALLLVFIGGIAVLAQAWLAMQVVVI